MKRLPKSIFKLQNLQALLVGAKGLEELPKDMRCMINRRFLFLVTNQKRFLEGAIGCLECLQTLFIVRRKNLEFLCDDMQGLRSLRVRFTWNSFSFTREKEQDRLSLVFLLMVIRRLQCIRCCC
uniref:Uncharacterized protein n=1 Tax=Populus alba TaxID=43335 RepID=A0A4U5QYD7_POPAL|nr:hypothetical protein D5086_0000032640 [Populus alba]